MKKKTRKQSAQRQRREAKGTPRPKGNKSDAATTADKAAAKASNASTADVKPKRRGALDAASVVLKQADKPMRCRELIETMAERGLWTSPKGKTPHATLYAAMMREARDKGHASRFRKVDRGLFAINPTTSNG